MIFVLEVKGTAVLAFEADDDVEARAYAADPEALEDLSVLTSDGVPLWNGRDAIGVRTATEAEADLFEEQRGEDCAAGRAGRGRVILRRLHGGAWAKPVPSALAGEIAVG
jgi:hypothetical protein